MTKNFNDFFNFNEKEAPPHMDMLEPESILDYTKLTTFSDTTNNLDGYQKYSAGTGVEISPAKGLSLTTGIEASLNRFETPISQFNTIGIGPKVTIQKDIGKNGKVLGKFTPASRYEQMSLGVSFNF